jgi:TRAP-type transport system small permease protein
VADSTEHARTGDAPDEAADGGGAPPRRGALGVLGLVGSSFDWVLQAVVCLLYVAILVVVNLAVFYRYVLDSPIIWSDTVGIWMFIWMSMLAAAVAIPRRAHMVVDVLPSLLPAKLTIVFSVIYFGSFIAAGYVLFVSGLELADVTGDRTGTAVDVPLRYPMLAIPVAAALFCIQAARALLRLCLRSGPAPADGAAQPASPAGDGLAQPEQILL